MTGSTGSAVLLALVRGRARPGTDYSLLGDEREAETLLERQHGLLAGQMLEQARRQIEAWSDEDINLLTVFDPDYPQNLRATRGRPPILFLTGRLEPADDKAVAVIGSRKATPPGLATAAAVSELLVENGYTVISGLAAGIDTAAHTAALERGGRTLAVTGTGLRHCYPPQNRGLQERIGQEGAVISQFMPDVSPSPKNFPRRNAVMSGLSLATVIVEASQTSGARTQARSALAQGRPLVLLDSLLSQQWARELALTPGVHVVGEPSEVPALLEQLGNKSLIA